MHVAIEKPSIAAAHVDGEAPERGGNDGDVRKIGVDDQLDLRQRLRLADRRLVRRQQIGDRLFRGLAPNVVEFH